MRFYPIASTALNLSRIIEEYPRKNSRFSPYSLSLAIRSNAVLFAYRPHTVNPVVWQVTNQKRPCCSHFFHPSIGHYFESGIHISQHPRIVRIKFIVVLGQFLSDEPLMPFLFFAYSCAARRGLVGSSSSLLDRISAY